jgi:SAM-dependent methyltransferase
MKVSVLEWLQCPACGGALRCEASKQEGEEILEGRLTCSGCPQVYPIVRAVPRFVPGDSYVGNFSFEWNVHRTTQVDSQSGRNDSEDRFGRSMPFPLQDLKGKLVLDIGCGTGRFAEVALKHGATVVGVDLSYAVDAAFQNLGRHPRMHIVQGDVFRLPLKREAFDLIYSLGVLHHTPDCRKAFEQLPPYLKAGGHVVITVYSNQNKFYVMSTNFWRTFTPKLPKRLLYALSHVAVPLYYFNRLPVLRYIGLGLLPISMDPDWRWRVLDTYDCYSPVYQSYHSYPEVFEWFEAQGLTNIRVVEPTVTVMGERPGGKRHGAG